MIKLNYITSESCLNYLNICDPFDIFKFDYLIILRLETVLIANKQNKHTQKQTPTCKKVTFHVHRQRTTNQGAVRRHDMYRGEAATSCTGCQNRRAKYKLETRLGNKGIKEGVHCHAVVTWLSRDAD